MSTITIYRQFKVKTVPNLSTITDAYSGDSFDTLISELFSDQNINEWLDTIQPKVDKLSSNLYIYSGNASSPNSGASSTKILDDVAGVIKDEKLFRALLDVSKHFDGHQHFHHLVKILAENVKIDSDFVKDKIHSRLFHFTAPGGKARIIANVDWLTQTALSGIHFMLFSLLSGISSDFTFNHKAGLGHIDVSKRGNYYSIDLSAATDRMPRVLQARILCGVLTRLGYDGEDIARHWLTIVDRVFKNSITDGSPIAYSVGQGMGIYTSWSVIALTHHFIINQLCKVSLDNYAVVGDDLLFTGTKDQYLQYLEINRRMGMTVNEGKTLQSEDTSSPTMEFARNFIIQGRLLSPTPHGLLFAWNSGMVSFETFLWAIRDNINLDILIDMIREYYNDLSAKEFLFFIFFLFKAGICDVFAHREKFESFRTLPKWASADRFRLVTETLFMPQFPHINRAFRGGFIDTFKSQCIVRKQEELLKNSELATAIYMLSFIDEELEAMSSIISLRLNSAQVISYTLKSLGCPLLSKSERKLLEEIDDYENR